MSSEICKKAFLAVSELIAEKCSIDPNSIECKQATAASLELIAEKCEIIGVPEIEVEDIQVEDVVTAIEDEG